MNLIWRHGPGAHPDHRIEEKLQVDGDRDGDGGKRGRARQKAAVEVLRHPVADLQIERELLLERELAADLVGPGARDPQLRSPTETVQLMSVTL